MKSFYYFNISKGTLLEQDVISKQTNEARIFPEIFCSFAAAWLITYLQGTFNFLNSIIKTENINN